MLLASFLFFTFFFFFPFLGFFQNQAIKLAFFSIFSINPLWGAFYHRFRHPSFFYSFGLSPHFSCPWIMGRGVFKHHLENLSLFFPFSSCFPLFGCWKERRRIINYFQVFCKLLLTPRGPKKNIPWQGKKKKGGGKKIGGKKGWNVFIK